MTTPVAGWYDDPWSGDQYRYWDGTAWTHHAAPKTAPPTPPAPPPVAAHADFPTYGSPTFGSPAPYGPGYATGGSTPRQADSGYNPYPATPASPSSRATTPDGAPLASWPVRLGARLLDNIFVMLISVPFNAYFWYRYFQAYQDYTQELQRRADAGATPNPFDFPSNLVQAMVPIVLITILVGLAYEVFSLRRWAATPGKRIVKSKVRGRDDPSIPPSMALIWRRCAFIYGVQLLYLSPLLGIVAGLLLLVDYLWPLWDKNRQALHDKVAGSNVVRAEAPPAPYYG